MPGPENAPTTLEPDVPAGAVRELSTGATLAVLFAEAMSSVRLFGLGERVGFAWYLAWLLPGALDVYALTMLRFSSRIPDGHRLRRKAMSEAILALTITVGCNALYEAVTAFARQLPVWAPGALFVLVSALAPFVAGRIIHFHAAIGHAAPASATSPQTASGSGERQPASGERKREQSEALAPVEQTSAPAATSATPRAPAALEATSATDSTQAQAPEPVAKREAPAGTGRVVRPQAPVATVTEIGASGGLSPAQWGERAAPVYRELMDRDGAKPSAPKLLEALIDRGLAQQVSPARARVIRKAAEDRLGLGDEPEQDDPDQEADAA
jgi:hypothetical protein